MLQYPHLLMIVFPLDIGAVWHMSREKQFGHTLISWFFFTRTRPRGVVLSPGGCGEKPGPGERKRGSRRDEDKGECRVGESKNAFYRILFQ